VDGIVGDRSDANTGEVTEHREYPAEERAR
jgi:hypothetical protein